MRHRPLTKKISRQAVVRVHRAIHPHLFGSRILDVGAAEGALGAALARDGHDVTLLDVVDLNRSPLPLRLYDGLTFPFENDSFDTVILSLVLHHCRDPGRVFNEAIRVSHKRLLISESVYRTLPGKWMLAVADRIFNGLRSGWKMPGALHFKKAVEWRRLFAAHGLILHEELDLSHGIHRHALFILDKAPLSPPLCRDEPFIP